MTKQMLRPEAEKSILSMEARGEDAKTSFLQQRLSGEINLWDKMTKVNFLNWDDHTQEQHERIPVEVNYLTILTFADHCQVRSQS